MKLVRALHIALCKGGAAVSHADLSASHSPLLNDFVVGNVRFQLLKGRFYSIEHRGVALANGDALFSCIDNRAAYRKLAWMLLIVVVGYGSVLVGRYYATICQQLYHSRLILQNSQVNSRFARFLTIV